MSIALFHFHVTQIKRSAGQSAVAAAAYRAGEKLQAEKEKVERQLAQEQHKIQRLENRAAYYEKGDRRKRAHRLITRGAAIESVAPQTKGLSETAFYAFAEQVFALPDAQRLLMEAVSRHAGGD